MINNLYLCHPDYVRIAFNKIESNFNNESFINFLKYLEDILLLNLIMKDGIILITLYMPSIILVNYKIAN